MGIFRRSMSSSSSVSCQSTDISTSGEETPRTSLESNGDEDISASSLTVKEPSTKSRSAPILQLPLELVQQINSHLDTASAAAFCLSSRYIYYALGTAVLSKYVEASTSRFEKRRTIESVVERAFPGHFFCAWCDQFHSWKRSDGPTTLSQEKHRNCAEFNSFLHSRSSSYTLCYHHIRLALNHSLWGPEHGIPLSAFTHTHSSMAKFSRTPIPTKLTTSARISPQGRFLLHTSLALILPTWCAFNKSLLKHLWPLLPHILSSHRASDNGHTGLMAALDNVVRRGWKYPFPQACSLCSTDWSVASHEFPHSTGSQVRVVVQSWRDLGDGRNPFDSAWRAHGVFMPGRESGEVVRLTERGAGDVKRAFESAAEGVVLGDGTRRGESVRSLSPGGIYRSFMRRKDGHGDGDVEQGDMNVDVRRSRARPRTWRTRSENEQVERKKAEDGLASSQRTAEDMERYAAERGRHVP
ncbi:hypothetical protein ACN47E_009183 [Coniothyrium glycines]